MRQVYDGLALWALEFSLVFLSRLFLCLLVLHWKSYGLVLDYCARAWGAEEGYQTYRFAHFGGVVEVMGAAIVLTKGCNYLT